MFAPLQRIVHEVNEAKDVEQAVAVIVTRVSATMAVDVCSVYLDEPGPRQLVLMAHTDLAGIAAILARAPDTDVIWAHAGFDVPLEELQALLEAHPLLWLELSFREGMLEAGVLTPAWRRFLDAHAGRCLAGTDTYTPGRWAGLAGLVQETRHWLAQLPEAQASQLAHDNAARLFGPPGPSGTP